MAVQYTGHVKQTRDNNTELPLVGVLVTCSGRINNIRQIHNQSENNNIPDEPEKLKFAPIII